MPLMYEAVLSSTNPRQSSVPLLSSSSQQQQNIADTLPSINFGFEDLRDRMAKFTIKFDAFIAEGRKRVLDERNEYRSKTTELAEDHKMKERSIEILSSKATTHAQTIAKEHAEAQDILAAIENISLQRDQRSDVRDRLKAEIASTQKLIAQRLEVQKQYTAKMDAQAQYNLPELDFWVDYLCMRIEGVGRADELQFVFTHVDAQDWEREASFELHMSDHEYRVERCKPKVDKEKLRLVVDRVNDSRDVAGFLKSMRELFVETMK